MVKSVAIFSRRTLQNLVNENSRFTARAGTLRHVSALNNMNDDAPGALSAEWEIVVLNSLSKLGRIDYEPPLGGSSRLDVHFLHSDPDIGAFSADITAVSDRALESDNPVEEFSVMMFSEIRKQGLDPDCFSVRIGDNRNELRGTNDRPTVKLPPQHEFRRRVFNSDFTRFLQEVKGAPSQQRYLHVKSPGVDVYIQYVPGQRFSFMSHLSYTEPHTITRNPVANALKMKAKQLKKSGYTGPVGIFLCDSGCEAAANLSRASNSGAIVKEFLRTNTSIAFVQVLAVSPTQARDWAAERFRVATRVYTGRNAKPLPPKLVEFLSGLATTMPRPEQEPLNARYRVSRLGLPNEGLAFRGAFKMTYPTVTISARSLLEFLSGRIDSQRFMAEMGFVPGRQHKGCPNPFETMLNEGRLIRDIRVEGCPTRDDDWVTIAFSDPDPAVSPFVVPDPAPPGHSA
ncbi:MAG: hypothetical protein ACLQOO_09340 [Terriglobia bacterium]